MDTLKKLFAKYERVVMLFCILFAVVGITPFLGACSEPMTVDAGSGEVRPATPDEAGEQIDAAKGVAETIVVSAGHPEWLPFVDLGARLAALLLAWRIKPLEEQKVSKAELLP